MRQMTKKKRSFIRSKIVRHLEVDHDNDITELKSSVLDARRKAVFFLQSGRRADFSLSLREIVPGDEV